MGIELHQLKPPKNSIKKPRRVGRGTGSGRGKTAGRGTKGQKSRSGGAKGPYFEGGQMPLIRRIPKRGFNHPGKIKYEIVNVSALEKFADNQEINPNFLKEQGLIKKGPVKILGNGSINKPLIIKANAFSRKAKELIESAGGKIEVI